MNELQLVVTKNVVGQLETNIEALENFVTERLKQYSPELYGGDAVSAKKDRAELNSAKAQIAESRKSLMKELMKPYSDFETRCKNLEKSIDLASGELDKIVKIREEQEKEAKKAEILEIWNSRNFSLVPFEKVFSPKWVNKTTKLSDVEAQIDTFIAQTYKDLKVIEKFADEADNVKAYYLDCLDISDALDFGEQLVKNKQKVAQEQAERPEREHTEAIERQKAEIRADAEVLNSKAKMQNLVADALEQEVRPVKKEWVLAFTGTDTQMLAVKNFLTMQGIEIKNCEQLEF